MCVCVSKHYWNPQQVEYLSSYLLYGPNHALRAFTVAPKVQFQNFDPMGKIVQNVKFSPIGQNKDLNLKLNPTSQNESRSMLSFQN